MSIDLYLAFTQAEMSAIDDWHQRLRGDPAPRQDSYRVMQVADSVGQWRAVHEDTVIGIARSQAFQREHPFAIIDYLPATRLVLHQPSPTIDLGMLNIDRVETDRYQMLHQSVWERAPVSLPNIASYLVTLDYQAFLAERQGLEVINEYERLAKSFAEATGKELLQPQYDPARGSNIEVKLNAGHRHGLQDLSSGEQEMMALVYFVRRLSATGGILCLDEPEQHLHPTLQAALFEGMRDIADRSQVIVVSHSVNLISAAPMEGLIQLSVAESNEINQALRLREEPDRARLVADLGIRPADLLQNDLILVVEGDKDSQLLQSMFPVELGRCYSLVAGSAAQVIDAYDTLDKTSVGIPWLCLRDRDLLTDEEIAGLKANRPNLHVWPFREIESCFLNASLIKAVLASVGKAMTADELEQAFLEASLPLQDEVLAQLVEAELSRRFPPPSAPEHGTRFQKLKAQHRAYSVVNQQRADALEDVLEEERQSLSGRWTRDWSTLADPKAILGALLPFFGVFHTVADLQNALAARFVMMSLFDRERLRSFASSCGQL
ncbi:MAG: AAA family ATPase [Actinomycetota bacterium]